MPEVIEEFYCEGCREWLVEGGIVHDDGEHEGAPDTIHYRYSYDGGKTWVSESPEDVWTRLKPEQRIRTMAERDIQCPDCKGYGDYGGTEDGRNIPCHVCRGEGVIKNTPRLQELLEETDD